MRIPTKDISVQLSNVAAVAWNKDNTVLEMNGGKHVTLDNERDKGCIDVVRRYMKKIEEEELTFAYAE